MSEPIVFISHFRVKEGKLDASRQLLRDTVQHLQGEKPRTLVVLAFVSKDGTQVTTVHVFAYAEAMDLHFQGIGERAEAAYEVFERDGWEIYGTPSDDIIESMRQAASSSGVTLTVQPEYVAGFLRMTSG